MVAQVFKPRVLLALLSCWPALAGAQERDAYDDDRMPSRPSDEQRRGRERDEETPSAGGLAAPEAMPEQGQEPTRIERELQRADEEDAHRGLAFAWIDVTLGHQWVTLDGLSSSNFAPDLSSTARSMFAYSLGAGVRLLYFTLGARFRNSNNPLYHFWTLGGEAALRVPLGSWEPYGGLGIGAAKVGKLQVRGAQIADGSGELTKIHGLEARLFGGLSYYFSDTFSIGGNLAGDLLFLKRPVQAESLCVDVADCDYSSKGRSLGLSVTTSVELGLHF